MEVQLLKEDVKTGEVVCQKYTQTMVEADIIVPDTKPDVKKVLEVSGYTCITQKTVQQDKVFIQGVVKMTVLYLPDGEDTGKIRSLTATQEFNHPLDCRGVLPDMQILAEATPESFDATMANSRRLNLRCVVGFGLKAIRPLLLSFTTGAEDTTCVALKKEPLRLMQDTDHCECQIILREQLELSGGKPPIHEIVKLTAVPTGTELCLMENKAVAKGQVKISVLYNSEPEYHLECMEFSLPFTEILDVEGATEDMTGEAEYRLHDIYYELRDDADGEARHIGIELVIGATVHGCSVTEIEAVTDAYMANGEAELQLQRAQIEQLLDRSFAELTCTDQAQLPSMLPRLGRVADIQAHAKIERIAVDQEEVTVFGTVHTTVLYLTQEDSAPVCGFHHISEFSQSFTVPGAGEDTACDAQVFLNHVSYTLSGEDHLELRFVLGLSVKSLKTGEVVWVDKILPTPSADTESMPYIILYYVQKGDTLWDIAKKYRMPIDHIQALNPAEANNLCAGQQLKLIRKTNP